MRIGIDCRALSEQNSYSSYLPQLLSHLFLHKNNHEWVLFCYDHDRFSFENIPEEVKIITIGKNSGVYNDFIYFSKKIKKAQIDFMYFIGEKIPFGTSIPYSIYLSNLASLAYPSQYGTNRILRYIKTLSLKKGAIKAKHLVFPLPFLAKDAQEFLRISEEKMYISAPGFASLIPKDISDITTEREISRVKEKFRISQEYFLYLGTIDERSNIAKMAEILAMLETQKISLDLVICGQENTAFYEFRNELIAHNVQQKVHILPLVENIDLTYLILGSKCVLHPAFYEGFYEPLLQSAQLQKTICAANITGIRELLGEKSFIPFSPSSIPSFQKALETALLRENISTLDSQTIIKEKLPTYSWESHIKTLFNLIDNKN